MMEKDLFTTGSNWKLPNLQDAECYLFPFNFLKYLTWNAHQAVKMNKMKHSCSCACFGELKFGG